MKLLQEDEEHLLPDAPQAQQPWYVRLFRKGLLYLLSPKGLTMAIGALLIVVLTGIVSLSYLDVSRNVDRNGIALKDFYADFGMEVVDQEATQRKVDRARQAIQPIYQPTEPHNQDITDSLNRVLSELGALATLEDASPEERHSRFTRVVGPVLNSDAVFKRYFQTPIPVEDWEQVALATNRAMQRILQAGFTEADDQKRDAYINQYLPRYGYKRGYQDLVYFLVDSSLEPNKILDEKAMTQRRSEVTRRITTEEPELRMFTRGQKIIGKGEKASAVQLAALTKMGKSTGSGSNWIACLGVLILTTLVVVTLWSYIYNFRAAEFFKPRETALIATLTTLTIAALQALEQGTGSIAIPVYAFPLASFALIVAIFTHPRIAVTATTLVVLLAGLSLRLDFFQMSVLLFGSFTGIYILGQRINYNDRTQLMYAGLYVGATNALVLLALSLLKPNWDGGEYLPGLMGAMGWGFSGGLFAGMLTIGSLPLLEKMFRLVTPFSLMELGNHDQPLLKRMQFEAPGTFHHSIMVATLAEAAAEAVGANALLTRVGCLYHDIGKMKRPLFFIENQAYFGVENPHDKLSPRLSKMVITAHPRDSIEMAKQQRLPECLMRFMTEHHGTLTAGYFYNKACIEEGVENVNKSQFRYPGPKPGSKETAIVMLADACESAVRALKAPSVAQVEERIDKIIQQRVDDGQFDNCPLTFKDLHQIKQTFVRVLRGIQHSRIEYQQNMMRELGRKLPAGTSTEHAGLQEALRQVQGQAATAGTGSLPPPPPAASSPVSPPPAPREGQDGGC